MKGLREPGPDFVARGEFCEPEEYRPGSRSTGCSPVHRVTSVSMPQLYVELVSYQKCEKECTGLDGHGVHSVSSSVCGEPLAIVGH